MLLTNVPQVNDIVTVRLTSGEEIIGKLDYVAPDGAVTLKKPVVLHMTQTKNGLDVAFGALLVSADVDTVRFTANALQFAPLITRNEIREGYQQATGGIVTPPKGLITR